MRDAEKNLLRIRDTTSIVRSGSHLPESAAPPLAQESSSPTFSSVPPQPALGTTLPEKTTLRPHPADAYSVKSKLKDTVRCAARAEPGCATTHRENQVNPAHPSATRRSKSTRGCGRRLPGCSPS